MFHACYHVLTVDQSEESVEKDESVKNVAEDDEMDDEEFEDEELDEEEDEEGDEEMETEDGETSGSDGKRSATAAERSESRAYGSVTHKCEVRDSLVLSILDNTVVWILLLILYS